MNPEFPNLLPGIIKVFSSRPGRVAITESNGQLSITYTNGSYTENRLFPYPTVNADLSVPLVAWVVTLTTQGV